MVRIRELQKYTKKETKSFDYEILRFLDSIGDLASIVKKFKKREVDKAYFKSIALDKLLKLLYGVTRLANSLGLDLEKPFEEWWKQKTKKKLKFDVEKGYDAVASFYDKLFNPAIITEEQTFLKLIGNVKGKKILDAGCGTGRYAVQLAKKGAEVYGIDISEKMLEIAKKKAKENRVKIELMKGNILRLPYEDNKFDIVISSLALDHVKEHEKAISELVRVCKPKGKIIFSIMHPDIIKDKFAWYETEEGVIMVRRYFKTTLDLVKAINKCKAFVEKIVELKISKKVKKTDPKTYKALKGKNIILIIKAKKP